MPDDAFFGLLKGTRGEELKTLSTIVIKNSCVLA
jgi:hypothetical protein